MFDGVKEDHSLELANLLRSGQYPSFDSAQRGFRSLPPPLPSTDPPPPHSTNGRNSRLAFLDHISASEDNDSSQEHSSVSSKHSSSTASLASHGSNNDALPVLCNLGLVNQGFKQEEEEVQLRGKKEESLTKETEDIPNQNHTNGHKINLT